MYNVDGFGDNWYLRCTHVNALMHGAYHFKWNPGAATLTVALDGI